MKRNTAPIRPELGSLRSLMKRLGYKLVWVPHKVIRDHNACYNVIYDGKKACPGAGERLGIPLNEIWISEKFKDFELYILFHELQEIKYRAEGLDGKTAHKRSEEDGIRLWKDDPNWRRLNKEIGVGVEHLVERYPPLHPPKK